LADTECVRELQSEGGERYQWGRVSDGGKDLADTNKQKPNGLPIGTSEENAIIGQPGWWTTEPDVGRVANGVSFRVDRIKGLGNAVVPAQAREAFKILMGIK
jgi:DNA (cytosine-5)-methyltransferase 1